MSRWVREWGRVSFPEFEILFKISSFCILHDNVDIMSINKALVIADNILMFEFTHKFDLFEDMRFILIDYG